MHDDDCHMALRCICEMRELFADPLNFAPYSASIRSQGSCNARGAQARGEKPYDLPFFVAELFASASLSGFPISARNHTRISTSAATRIAQRGSTAKYSAAPAAPEERERRLVGRGCAIARLWTFRSLAATAVCPNV